MAAWQPSVTAVLRMPDSTAQFEVALDDLHAGAARVTTALERSYFWPEGVFVNERLVHRLLSESGELAILASDNRNENELDADERLRLALILEEGVRNLHFPAPLLLTRLHAIMVRIERLPADLDYRARLAREWLEEAIAGVDRVEEGKPGESTPQKDLEKELRWFERDGAECLRSVPSLARCFVERWALGERMDVCLAQRAEVLAACTDGRRGWLSVTRPFIWALCVAINLWGMLTLLGGRSEPVAYRQPWSSVMQWVQSDGWVFPAALFLLLLVLWGPVGRSWAPRLGATSILGYAALTQLPGAPSWNDASPRGWPIFLLPLLCLVLAGIYLRFGEVGKRVRDQRVACCRSVILLGLGLAQSWAIGAVGFWFLAKSHSTTWPPIYWLWGPPALLIGLIVQSLWQKEAITEPIST